MSLMKKYQKDVEEITTTNIAFSGIKEKVIMNTEVKKTNKNHIIIPSIFGGLALVATSVILVVALTTSNAGGNNPQNPLIPNDARLSMKGLAKSATPLMSSQLSFEENQRNIRPIFNTVLANQEKSEEDIIRELLGQFDTIIQNDNNYVVEAVESDKEEYKYKEIITFKDLLNNSNSYSLYYNEALVNEENGDDEFEKETSYEGVAVKDEKEYFFRLELEEETEEDEQEIESTFYLFSTEDKKTFTKVTSSSEIEGLETETEYSYEIYENGVLTTSYEMEIEIDPTENEVELSIELNEVEYSIEREIKGEDTYFLVEFENDATDEESEWVFKKVISGDEVTYELITYESED